MTTPASRPASVLILVLLIFFQGLSGLIGGFGLVFDPSGESLNIPLRWLDQSPFPDYLIPGLILLTALGVFPLVIGYGLWMKMKRAWYGAGIVGVALVIWIVVEILIIGYQPQPPLQAIYGAVGVLILMFTLLPSVRKYYNGKRVNMTD